MLTTAILGLLNHNQVFYATKMTQLVAFDVDKKALKYESVSSYSENDSHMPKGKKTNKSIYTDKIAKDLVNS